jgi:hypothetical protein
MRETVVTAENAPFNGRRLVCVIGCQRSGTTLAAQILGAHDQAALIDEDDGLYRWLGGPESIGLKLDPACEPMIEDRAARKYRAPRDRFVMIEARHALAPSVEALVLKAPNLTFNWRAFAQEMRKAVFIAPIRDPRAVAASMLALAEVPMIENQVALILKTPPGSCEDDVRARLADAGTPAHVKAALIWRVKNALCEAVEGDPSPVRVRYEDLTDDPEAVSVQLAAAASLDPAGLRAHPAVMTGHGPGKTDRARAVDKRSRRSWTERFSLAEAAEILDAAGPLAQRYGYAGPAS